MKSPVEHCLSAGRQAAEVLHGDVDGFEHTAEQTGHGCVPEDLQVGVASRSGDPIDDKRRADEHDGRRDRGLKPPGHAENLRIKGDTSGDHHQAK